MKNDVNIHTENYFSNKKTIVQFVLALFVFFIHFRVFSTYKVNDGYFSKLLEILNSLTHVAVPLFFVISAALFYRNYDLTKTLKKWKSRFFSLLVPYLIWNTLWLFLAILGYYTPLGALLGGLKTAVSFEAIFSGIFLNGFFEPFWFIRQLIVLTALCPIIYLLLKNKIIGLIIIGICFVLHFLGFETSGILIQTPRMVIVYLIGAWIGMHHFDWLVIRRSKSQAFVALGAYIACCVFMGTKDILSQFIPIEQLSFVVIVISCFAFYISFDLFKMKSCPRFMKDSFLIYALHSFIGAALSKILSMVLPSNDIYLFLNAVITFVSTIVVICLCGKFLERYTPQLKKVLVGR